MLKEVSGNFSGLFLLAIIAALILQEAFADAGPDVIFWAQLIPFGMPFGYLFWWILKPPPSW